MAKKQFVSNENARRYDHEICLSYLKKCEVIKLKVIIWHSKKVNEIL